MRNKIAKTVSGIVVHDSWKPLVEREPSHAPEYADERDRPLEFVLTPRERDLAAMATLYLEDRRRRLNEQDEVQPFITRNPRKGGEL